MSANILSLDVETAPNNGWFWGLFKQNIGLGMIKSRGYMLCYRAKWLGKKEIIGDAIWFHPKTFRANPESDLHIAKSLWKLLDKADIVIAHNGRRFDFKWANSLFIKYRLGPCSPYKVVDTLEAANQFKFVSRKLENIAIELFKDHKMETGGIGLWLKCMSGVKAACVKMYKYCGKDVLLLERAYLAMRPYMTGHPNVNLYSPIDKPRCPLCSGDKLQYKGLSPLAKSLFPRYKCLNTLCGHHFRLGGSVLTKEERAKIGVSIK